MSLDDRASCAGPEWTAITNLGPASERHAGERRLLGALLTTYQPPSPEVLIEEFLPGWLALERTAPSDNASPDERCLFYLELDRRLKELHGKLAIFCSSSPATDEPASLETVRQHWLWRFIRLYTVGRQGPAVQHAKLWMFHWEQASPDKGSRPFEFLQIVVSSTNLTRDALRNQIQAGWTATLSLGSSSKAKGRTWGVLSPFITALGQAAGGNGAQVATHWVGLLSRVGCPDGVTFVASIPGEQELTGKKAGRASWGMAALRTINFGHRGKVQVDVLVPTVGRWRAMDINAWAGAAQTRPGMMSLAWITEGHGWARHWQMPSASAKTLRRGEATFVDASSLPSLHGEWRKNDARWPHAKLYWFCRGSRIHLLITSANFSPAAWGRVIDPRRIRVENFELGVLIESGDRPYDGLPALNANESLWTSEFAQREPKSLIAWADAQWDGKMIRVECRMSRDLDKIAQGVKIKCQAARSRSLKVRWRQRGQRWSASIPWSESQGIPLALELAGTTDTPRQAEEMPCTVIIADVRAPSIVASTPHPEVPADWHERLELKLIEERYGGSLADGAGTDGEDPPVGDSGGPMDVPADYSVEVIALTRQKSGIIDAWSLALQESSGDAGRWVLCDGKQLLRSWDRLSSRRDRPEAERIAASLAARELKIRLKHQP